MARKRLDRADIPREVGLVCRTALGIATKSPEPPIGWARTCSGKPDPAPRPLKDGHDRGAGERPGYSDRRLSTGFTVAARTAWKLTVTSAMTTA
ncbi:MAG TPA: hypothetical protein VNW04_12060, partial [Puia sp.]|nr:hypothetical protein [Puia sp.]